MTDNITLPIPSELIKYQNQEYGIPAPGNTIPVDTEMHIAQRDLSTRDIIKWCHKHKGVDWNLFGYATAVELADGTRKLINGQHRIQLVKWLLPDLTEIPAHVIKVSDDNYIGRLFADMNGGSSRKLTPEDLLWAEIIGGDPKALYVKEWLEAAGLACGKVNDQNGNDQISRHAFEKCLKYGEQETVYAVDLCRNTFKKRRSVASQIVTGLTLLFSMPEYAELGDISTKRGQAFRSWFLSLPMAGIKLSDLEFPEYKNLAAQGKWEVGVVYGLVQKYVRSMDAQGRGSMKVEITPAKRQYQGKYNVADNTDSED